MENDINERNAQTMIGLKRAMYGERTPYWAATVN
jgi:hypothetical protein